VTIDYPSRQVLVAVTAEAGVVNIAPRPNQPNREYRYIDTLIKISVHVHLEYPIVGQ
jgi:hypothetical protein